MPELRICSAAEREFAEALSWYAERNTRAAERFEAEFSRSLASIAKTPERYPCCSQVHRFYLMRKFPYQIVYQISKDTLTVIAVAHTARKPGYWAGR